MEELISVIIPVYNVKPFLVECLDSVINQSYSNLEIIVVDDGSNDGSEKICDEYKLKDDRIKVIHKENGGLSSARNAGIDCCLGNFITFIDSDDYIHKDMIKILYNDIKNNDADMTICNYSNVEDLEVKNEKDIKVFCELEEILGNLYNEYNICFGTAWGKLYKKSLFNKIRYPLNRKYEDTFIIHRIFEKVKKLVYSENKLYYYRIRRDSIMNQKYSLKNLDELDAILDRMNFVKERNFEYFYARDFYRYVNALRRHYIQIRENFPNEKAIYKELIVKFNKNYNLRSRKLIFNNKLRWRLDVFYIKSLIIEKILKIGD